MSDFPSALTEEEEYLLERFRILNEKKKLLQKLKEKAEFKVKPVVKREAQETSKTPEDAKKKAEMLVASGKVQISKSSVEREFKRARTSEKKIVKDSLSDNESFPTGDKKLPSRTAMKEMYTSSFVKGGRSENDTDSAHGYRGFREPRRFALTEFNLACQPGGRVGNTIFVRGYGLREDIVKTAFNKFGTVVEYRYEKERSHGFVTFQTCEEAEKAIEEMNGTVASEIHIEVSLARKQLHIDNARGNRPVWASRDYRSQDRQERPPEVRELKTYEEDDFLA